MQISVITPVFNAATFVTRSVESALAQPETAEVILVEDGSQDNSLEVCQGLATKYEKVHLYRHPNGENRGAGASRNLGMQKCTCEYIAFIDADDYYLPDRFMVAKEVILSNPDCDGVYENIGMHMEDEASLERWKRSKKSLAPLTGLKKPFPPEELTLILINGQYGSLTLDGLLLKKCVLDKSGYMNENLRLHQDTEFIIRVTVVAKLFPGMLDKPVAIRGVHDHNRVSTPRSQAQKYRERMLYWTSLYTWCRRNANQEIQRAVLKGLIRYTRSHGYFDNMPLNFLPTRIIWASRLIRLFAYPEVIIESIRMQNKHG